MSDVLYEVFSERHAELAANLSRRLRNSTARHYREMAEESLQIRAATLVENFHDSFRTKPARFVDYVAEIARERISEDYRLKEILMALRILEELAWEVTVDAVPVDQQVRALARVTGTIGAAKDRLAEIWVDHVEDPIAGI